MQSALLLNVVICERAAILQLLARENQPLLVGRDALLVLNLLLHVLDAVTRLGIERDGLARQRFDEDLHGSFCWRKSIDELLSNEISCNEVPIWVPFK